MSLLCLCVARVCRHHLSRVHPYRAGVQSEPDCSSPSYIHTYNPVFTFAQKVIRDKFTLGDPLCAGWAPAQRRRQETKDERNKRRISLSRPLRSSAPACAAVAQPELAPHPRRHHTCPSCVVVPPARLVGSAKMPRQLHARVLLYVDDQCALASRKRFADAPLVPQVPCAQAGLVAWAYGATGDHTPQQGDPIGEAPPSEAPNPVINRARRLNEARLWEEAQQVVEVVDLREDAPESVVHLGEHVRRRTQPRPQDGIGIDCAPALRKCEGCEHRVGQRAPVVPGAPARASSERIRAVRSCRSLRAQG